MARPIIPLAIAAALILPVPADAEPHAQRLIIGIDLSDDAIVVTSPAWTAKVAKYLDGRIAALPLLSRVVAATFSDGRPDSSEVLADDQLTFTHRPAKVGKKVAAAVARLGDRMKDGTLKPGRESHILGFLENQARQYGCAGTTLILVSDGLEFAAGGTNAYQLLKQPKAGFPAPPAIFAGCRLEVVGFGQGSGGPQAEARLRVLYETWTRQAGFADVRLLRDVN